MNNNIFFTLNNDLQFKKVVSFREKVPFRISWVTWLISQHKNLKHFVWKVKSFSFAVMTHFKKVINLWEKSSFQQFSLNISKLKNLKHFVWKVMSFSFHWFLTSQKSTIYGKKISWVTWLILQLKNLEHMVNTPESNEMMRSSYLILDEYMRFLDCSKGGKDPSPSILDVGVQAALNMSGFDERTFFKRGGKYKWSKMEKRLDWWILNFLSKCK